MKKIIYFLLTIFLAIELSFLLHLFFLAVLELTEVEAACAWNSLRFFNSFCLFPDWARATTLILGLAGGAYLAPWWWRVVYVEKRWRGWKRFRS